MGIPDHLACLLRSPLLIAALFTIANAWTQSKHSSADECMKTWYICAMEHCLSHEKNKMPFVAIWMELDIIILCEVNKKKTNTTWYHLYMESKIWPKWTYPQNRHRPTDIESRLMAAKGSGVGEGWNANLGLANANYYINI